MKTLTTKMTIAAAALLVAAGVASAESMRAEIPFSFRAGSAEMTAGSYYVTTDLSTGGITSITLANRDTQKAARIVAPMRIGDYSEWKDTQAKLVFQCVGSTCTLQKVWNGTPGRNFQLPTPHSHDKELSAIRIVSVRLQ